MLVVLPPLLLLLALALWGAVWVRRRMPDDPVARLAPAAVVVCGAGTMLGSASGLAWSFWAVSNVGPESRQSALATGISVAMWSTSLGYVAVVGLIVGLMVLWALKGGES